MIDADLGVFQRRRHLQAAQHSAGTGCIAVDQQADQALDVVLRAGQPVLHGQEISPHILGGTLNETQDLGQAAQHLHLLFASTGFLFGAHLAGLCALATQFFKQLHRPAAGRLHVKLAHAGELADLGGRHQADHGIALIAPRLQGRQHRQKVLFHEEHGGNHDVAFCDVAHAALKGSRIMAPLRCRMNAHLQARHAALQLSQGPLGSAGQMAVHGHQHHTHEGTCPPRLEVARGGPAFSD